MPHVYPSTLNLLVSFTFDEDEEMENVLQAEERNISQEMEKTNMQKTWNVWMNKMSWKSLATS